MSCYVNDLEVFAVIYNTLNDIYDKRTAGNMYNRSYIVGYMNDNKLTKEKLKESLLKCYNAQVLSYKKRYGEKTEKINFIEELDKCKVTYYAFKEHKEMLAKSILCMLYQIETRFSKKIWEGVVNALLKDIYISSEEFEAAEWGYGKLKEYPKKTMYTLVYYDPESDDDKFGMMSISNKRSDLVDKIKEDLEIHYPDGEAKEEIEKFITDSYTSNEEELEFEFEGRGHYYKIIEGENR